ncbi:matrixin family metalloprotease [Actinomadura sp. 6K520]|uniref:matrixin family metalloprotease n=1 Tax=Actinomadura sp. 6K520 TaxID=2530364 RepID=UPI001043C208|nr:matrixin family metalloprotease [Actinomadura sp. 6K520]TDE27135.1 matrixin family metalloprotease [Actinomadura sp. 6K520]
MHGYSRGFRQVAVTAAVAAMVAGTTAAGAGPAAAAPRPAAWCKPGGTLQTRAMPRHVKIADCDLRGRTVRGANGLTAVVPADGTSLVVHALRTTGGGAELRVEVDDRAGEVTFSTSAGRVPQGRPRGARAPANVCRDGAYRLGSSRWPRGSTITWRHHPGRRGLPVTGIIRGVSNMSGARTDCVAGGRFTPAPNVGTRHAGRAGGPPNVTRNAGCGTRDRANTFGWVAMTGAGRGVLAATCVWFRGGSTLETDMALQEQGKRWWSRGSCPSGSYSTEAVATHEAGHVLGLGHVAGANHSRLTMAPSVAACDNGLATLGRGDYNGLIALYGAR